MITRLSERVLSCSMVFMLIVAMMCLFLGMANMPSWSLCLQSMANAGKNDASDMFLGFVDNLGAWYNSIPTETTSGYLAIDILANLVLKIAKGIYTIVYFFGLVFSYLGYVFMFVCPALTQFGRLWGEGIATTFGHIGNTTHIAWDSMSGDFGYPDPCDISSILGNLSNF